MHSFFKSITLLMLISFISLTGCTQKESINRETVIIGDKQITVIADSQYTIGKDIVENIKVYEGIKGFGWLSAEKILAIAEDENIDKENQVMFYDLRKALAIKDQNTPYKNLVPSLVKVSPDGKYVFFVSQVRQEGYILDLEGHIKATAKGPTIGELAEAQWYDTEGLIMPYKETGFYSIKSDGEETKILDVENSTFITSVKKVENQILYITQTGLESTLKVYNLQTKVTSVFFEGRVTDFYLSPLGDRIIVRVNNLEQDIDTLYLMTIEGKNSKAIAEGRMIYGASWSTDGTRFAYIINSRGDGDEGLFMIEMDEMTCNQLSARYLDISNDIVWNPYGRQLMLETGEVKEGKWIDNMHIITIK